MLTGARPAPPVSRLRAAGQAEHRRGGDEGKKNAHFLSVSMHGLSRCVKKRVRADHPVTSDYSPRAACVSRIPSPIDFMTSR